MNTPSYIPLIDRYIREGGFSGGAVAVAQHGQMVIEHYAGWAAPNLPASPDVLWPLASISKLYSVAMVMRIVEQGHLTLNTLVSHVIPQFTGEGREEVRLRHLLTHTSGLIYESPEMEARLIAQTPRAALVEEAFRAPLQFKAGTSMAYADYNTLLAGHMAEVVMGESFADLVQKWVIGPMKLSNTFMPPPPSEYGRIAKVANVMAEGSAGAMYNSPYALSLAHPAFGTVATLHDLIQFGQHFAPGGPRIHSPLTVRAMTSDQTGGVFGKHVAVDGLGPNTFMPWGLGFMLQTPAVPSMLCDLASNSSFGHGGASGCQLLIDPENEVVACVVSNNHVRIGRERWRVRLQSILNSALATL